MLRLSLRPHSNPLHELLLYVVIIYGKRISGAETYIRLKNQYILELILLLYLGKVISCISSLTLNNS